MIAMKAETVLLVHEYALRSVAIVAPAATAADDDDRDCSRIGESSYY
jgi:hypothetical protein